MSEAKAVTADEMAAANENLMRQLAHEGIQLDVLSMLKMRLDYLTEWVLKGINDTFTDESRNDEFAKGWERVLADALEGAMSEVTRAKLSINPPHQQLSLVDGLR